MRIDCHNDTVSYLRRQATLESLPEAHLDYQRLRSHLDLAFFAIFVHQQDYAGRVEEEFSRLLSALTADIEGRDDLALLRRACQLEQDPPEKPLILISMEGASPLENDPSLLDKYFAAGLRALGLTWNFATAFAGGAKAAGGLTEAGRDLVRRCNRLGVLLDGAHASPQTFADLLRVSQKPIIDSHTVCAALGPHFGRGVSDEELRALAYTGGVACITLVADFLGQGGGLDRACEHIEYAVSLVGSEHVGLGADYDGADLHPELAGVQFLPDLYRRLRQRGMSEYDLDNVAGGSVRRLLRQVLPR